MEDRRILKYFEGKTIFITGASGFLAKIFLEKILRIQPKVKKIFLLLRPTTEKTIEERLHEEIFSSELFRVLNERNSPEVNHVLFAKVIPVCGDVAKENLGITDSELRDEMWGAIDIFVNSAATTRFDERYDVALGINALGALNVEKFARNCAKLEMLLHVSTAFVSGNKLGLIQEKPFQMGETLHGATIPYLDINMEKKIAEERLRELQNLNVTEKEITRAMRDLGIQRAMMHGWPNTYSFTKAIGEMLLGNFKDKAKVVILRPTIVTSTYEEPFPGWIEGLRTLDSIFVTYARGNLEVFIGDPELILDIIPGDMVVNSMLAAIASSSNSNQDSPKLLVHHVGSSLRNPLKLADLSWLMHRYITKCPFLDKKGKPIRIQELTLDTMDNFHRYFAIRYLPFMKVLRVTNMIFCNLFKNVYENATQRIDRGMRLAELYKPYVLFRVIFDDTNTENLRMAIRGSNMNGGVLNFDPKCIHWEEYFVNTHFHGIATYVLK